MNDELIGVAKQIVRYDLDKRTNIALDFFDASLNRVGAYVLGIRSAIKSLLIAILEPMAQINEAEERRDYLSRLAIMEESKFHPVGAVWDYYCLLNEVPTESEWLKEAIDYEDRVLSKRV